MEKVIARSSPNWLEIKNVCAEFWPFLFKILKPLGNTLQIIESRVTLPHLHYKIIINALAPRFNILGKVSFNFDEEVFCWDVEILSNLNASFHCKRNNHNKRECRLLKINK